MQEARLHCKFSGEFGKHKVFIILDGSRCMRTRHKMAHFDNYQISTME